MTALLTKTANIYMLALAALPLFALSANRGRAARASM